VQPRCRFRLVTAFSQDNPSQPVELRLIKTLAGCPGGLCGAIYALSASSN
jgi:hypothetical protein